MRALIVGSSVSILSLVGAVCAMRAQTAPHPLVTQAQYQRWQTDLSNWGRWGKDDELGTLNLITPAKRKQAAALVKEGLTVSLASDAVAEKSVDVPCPVEWAMVTASSTGATDRIGYPCIHGAGTTHLDSFAHVFFGGKMLNGYSVSALGTKDGRARQFRDSVAEEAGHCDPRVGNARLCAASVGRSSTELVAQFRPDDVGRPPRRPR